MADIVFYKDCHGVIYKGRPWPFIDPDSFSLSIQLKNIRTSELRNLKCVDITRLTPLELLALSCD